MSATRDELLHVQQVSLEWVDTAAQVRADARTALDRDAHAVGWTEAQSTKIRRELAAACTAKGYRLIAPDRAGTVLAIRKDLRLIAYGRRHALDAVPGPFRTGGRPVKFVTWGTFVWAGETVTAIEAHWPNRARENAAAHRRMTSVVADLARVHGRGRRLAVWMGDANVDDGDRVPFWDAALNAGQLSTVWDELGHHPSTHGRRTIDVIGTYDPDKRLSVVRARSWPRQHSDHAPTSAWFRVNNRKDTR